MEKKKYFVPLTKNREYWKKTKNYLLIDDFFQLQLSDSEKSKENLYFSSNSITYDTVSIEFFLHEIIGALYQDFNQIFNTDFSYDFWLKLHHSWLSRFLLSVYFRCSLFDKVFSDDNSYESLSCSDKNIIGFLKKYGALYESDDFNLLLSAKICEKFYGVNVTYVDKADKILTSVSNNDTQKKLKENTSFLVKVLKKVYRKVIFFKKQKLLLWCTYFDGDAIGFFRKKTMGEIGDLTIPSVVESDIINYDLRNSLKSILVDRFSTVSEKWKKIAIDLLFEFIPFYYVEDFSKYLNNAKLYLKSNGSVKTIFATCLGTRNENTFFIFYAQSKGVKILTKQHGGDYGFGYGLYNEESFLSDTFYGWGNWTSSVLDSKIPFISCPSYRNYLLFQNKPQEKDFILYVGSCVSFYNSYYPVIKYPETNLQYIERQKSFFSNISKDVLSRLLLRNFWLEYGYGINGIIHNNIPELKIQNYLQANYNEAFDPGARNQSFSETLLNCSLMIYDDIETPFVEALYCDKPFILLLDKDRFTFRGEEIPFIIMMEKVGLIQYNPQKTAEYVSDIANDITSWWNEPKRQEVVKVIRERYCMKVDDPKKWWFKEFKRQLKLCKHNKVDYE